MILGNVPRTRKEAIPGKRYWRLSVGKEPMPQRFFSDGWRAFELVIFQPFPADPRDHSSALSGYSFRFAFAYWLPIYFI